MKPLKRTDGGVGALETFPDWLDGGLNKALLTLRYPPPVSADGKMMCSCSMIFSSSWLSIVSSSSDIVVVVNVGHGGCWWLAMEEE